MSALIQDALRRARRFKSAAELEEVRRVAGATCAAFRRVAELLAASESCDGELHLEGEPLRVARGNRGDRSASDGHLADPVGVIVLAK